MTTQRGQSRRRNWGPTGLTPAASAAIAVSAAGAAATVWATTIERNAFTLRRATVPILPMGARQITVLHLSDFHMMPNQRRKQRWISKLAELQPDLVVNTGDNLAHPSAVPSVVQALAPLLSTPGFFVFGSNDYFAPAPKNPFSYLGLAEKKLSQEPLPWTDLRAAFAERGWIDLTHRRRSVTIGDCLLELAGVDDPHLGRDRYDAISGPVNEACASIGLTHSPEPRVLDQFAADGFDLVLAGHTHGGQIRLPTGAIITNCGLDRSRARGLSAWGERMFLHVSAGLGTSPWVPVRTFCPPEASLLTLVPRESTTTT